MPNPYTCKNDANERPCQSGPLSNQSVLFQPNLSVGGWLCNAGSRALTGYHALEDATVVTRLSRAGAVPAGSTRMAELGFGLAGDTSARLIAEGQADLAIVTDTMGEARMAAAGAGLFGFKPSHGLISRRGLIGLVPSMECPGIVARDPARIIAALSVMAGPDPGDPSMPDDCACGFDPCRAAGALPRTIGVISAFLQDLSGQERRAWQNGLDRLQSAGLTLKEVSLADWALFRDTHHAIAAVEASSSAGKYDGVRYGLRASGKNWNEMYLNTRKESFGPLIKSLLFQGAYFQFEAYAAFENACRLRRHLVHTSADLFSQVDLLAMPTRRLTHDAACAATVSQTYDAFALTLVANLTGQPALQLPGLAIDGGLDAGLQLIGLRLDDARVLNAGLHLSMAQEGK
jgi:aspartyl-tRNA(Asn)/glutamyl-tRNA(Gln) amidotransferase subunit A